MNIYFFKKNEHLRVYNVKFNEHAYINIILNNLHQDLTIYETIWNYLKVVFFLGLIKL